MRYCFFTALVITMGGKIISKMTNVSNGTLNPMSYYYIY